MFLTRDRVQIDISLLLTSEPEGMAIPKLQSLLFIPRAGSRASCYLKYLRCFSMKQNHRRIFLSTVAEENLRLFTLLPKKLSYDKRRLLNCT